MRRAVHPVAWSRSSAGLHPNPEYHTPGQSREAADESIEGSLTRRRPKCNGVHKNDTGPGEGLHKTYTSGLRSQKRHKLEGRVWRSQKRNTNGDPHRQASRGVMFIAHTASIHTSPANASDSAGALPDLACVPTRDANSWLISRRNSR